MSSDVENSATATPPSGDEEAGAPERGATRAPIQCPVRLQFDDAIEVVEGTCRNVSIGGMFVRSAEARPKGSLVRFELVLEDQASIRGLAEVVWMRPRDEASGRQAGMGLRFRFLEQRDRQMIFKLVSQHIKERLASRHPSMEESMEEGAEPAPEATRETVTDPAREATEPPETREAAPVRPPPAAEATESVEQRSLLFDQHRFDEDETGEAGPPAGRPSGEPVVDEFDRSDERTAAWMNAAVAGTEPDYATYEDASDDDESREEGYDEGDDTAWDGDASWVGGSARVQGEERGPLRILAAVAVLVVLAALGIYVFGDRIFGGAEDVAPVGETATVPESDSRTPTEDETEMAAETAAETTAAPEGETPSAEPAPPPPPAAVRQQTSPPAAEPTEGAFRRIRDISVRQVGDVSRVVIETDGAIAADRYSHSRITTAPPRELIRLRGLTTRFTREIIPVGGPRVSRVRTGWHRKAGGNELHVVLDLASPSARVTELTVDGSRLIATVEGS